MCNCRYAEQNDCKLLSMSQKLALPICYGPFETVPDMLCTNCDVYIADGGQVCPSCKSSENVYPLY